ncbi:beta-lactamase family protein [uncultured Winogradskyella sp.]|uniref:beta-lactamase family protein n=1 Tax=uncultured Winogradskyella sp. TaxID=395353 RepID=UPI00260505C8|nr:beta-lactamase family protein [uncultured Winogradskyella sp.]
MKKPLLIAICFTLFFSCKEEVKETLSPEVLAIQELVLKQKELFEAPGIAVGMIKNDTIVYADAHGVQSLNTKKALTTKSIFHMASVSKPFVATAVIQLVEEGKIDLDEKLTHYLPYYTMADERYKDVTIRQMLSHTSGIPNTDDYEWDKPQYDDGAAERYARSQNVFELDFTPGTEYSYSNPAFDILCDVISKASGMTFEAYMKQNIFEPVGMVNSTFFKPGVSKELATSPHVLGDSLQLEVSKIYPYNRRHAGSSTLHSNVDDMLLWARVNLNKGTINGKRIYSEESYKLLTTIQTPKNQRKVGLSWFLGTINDNPFVYHAGSDTGYHTFFGFMPQGKVAITLMVNTDNFQTSKSIATIIRNSVFNDSITVNAPIHYKLKNYILTENIKKVKEIYFTEKSKAVKDYDFDDGYLDDLGYWLIDRNHPKEALDVFLLLVEVDPNYAGWVSSVGDAYKELDSIDQAIQWHKKALKMNPKYEYPKEEIEKLLKKKSLK